MAKSYRHESILLTIKQLHYYKELIKQPQVHVLQYHNNKKKKIIYMFPEKLFSHLTNPNLGSPTCSYKTGTHISSMSSLEEAVLFFQPHWIELFIGRPSQLKLNYHGQLGSDTQFFCHSLLLTT